MAAPQTSVNAANSAIAVMELLLANFAGFLLQLPALLNRERCGRRGMY
jgi:hypothetical protein